MSPAHARMSRWLRGANIIAASLVVFEAGYLLGLEAGEQKNAKPSASAEPSAAATAVPSHAPSARPSVAAPPPSASAHASASGVVEDLGGPEVAALAASSLEDTSEPSPQSMIDDDALIALIPLKSRDEASLKLARDILGPRTMHVNQGNPAIAKHDITRAQCLAALKGVTLQTPDQKAICKGDNEVPIYTDGDPHHAKACMDVFEYPNKECVRPFVYAYAKTANQLCQLAGKRLCKQEEWVAACEADPSGGAPRKYSYGDDLDLKICDTGKKWPQPTGPACQPDGDVWSTCATLSEPAGSFPQCKSRLGVYDMQGNVAELMTRAQDKVTYVQFKGSAFFYDGKMYPDTCRDDPRWHADPVDQSWHTNYHLGFRCCRDVE
ncbi:MAG: SUMF1/EgtB/PvdO family nonheme iron enzyme [Polyangiales bacterium]